MLSSISGKVVERDIAGMNIIHIRIEKIIIDKIDLLIKITSIYVWVDYIAFAIFVDLLKRNELEKINNLSDEDIERLEKNARYK